MSMITINKMGCGVAWDRHKFISEGSFPKLQFLLCIPRARPMMLPAFRQTITKQASGRQPNICCVLGNIAESLQRQWEAPLARMDPALSVAKTP
jgi:hypothetical protein